jgi:hypothetical protein
MNSLADGLPAEIARQIHPDWRKNEAAYWAVRDQLLGQYQGQWIGFADGVVVASGARPVVVFHAAHQAAEQVRETSNRVREGVENGYAKAEGMVQSRPAESVLMAFGCGLAVGVGITLLLGRDRPSDNLWNRSRDSAEGLAKRFVDAIASRTG